MIIKLEKYNNQGLLIEIEPQVAGTCMLLGQRLEGMCN